MAAKLPEWNDQAPSKKQKAWADRLCSHLGIDAKAALERFNLRPDKGGYHLLINRLQWIVDVRAYRQRRMRPDLMANVADAA